MDFYVNTEISKSVTNQKCCNAPSYTNNLNEINGIEEWRVNEYWQPDEGPHQVWVNISIHKLDRIDTVNQTFGTDFTVVQSWIWSKMDEQLNGHLLCTNSTPQICSED